MPDNSDIFQKYGVPQDPTSVPQVDNADIYSKYGVPTPGQAPAQAAPQFDRSVVNTQFKKGWEAPGTDGAPAGRKATTWLEAMEAGWQASTAGLITRGKAPDIYNSEDSNMFYRIASQATTLMGDVPAMIAGGFAGEVAGLGNPIAGAAGAFALPATMRRALMDHYTKGDVKDFGDFWARTSAAMIDGAKGGITGAATEGLGGLVGGFTGSALAKNAAQVATMVTVGKGLEGQAPHPNDFIDAALLVGGMHAVLPVAAKLREIYADKGVLPGDTAQEAQTNPVLKQELVATNIPNPPEAASAAGIPKPAELNLKDPKFEDPATYTDENKFREVVQTQSQAETLADHLTEQKDAAEERIANDKRVAGDQKLIEDGKNGLAMIDKVKDSLVGDLPVTAADAKTTEPTKTEGPPRSEAEKVLEGQMERAQLPGVVDKVKGQVEGVKGNWNEFTSKFYQNFVDKFDPIKRAVQELVTNPKSLLDVNNPYSLARATNDYAAKVRMFIRKGTFDHATLANNGESYDDIIKLFKDDLGKLDLHLMARRTLEIEGRQTRKGTIQSSSEVLDAARQVLKEHGDTYGDAPQRLVDYQNRTLKYLADSGRISQKLYDTLVDANKAYVPFARVVDATYDGLQSGRNSLKAIGTGVGGDNLKLVSPLQSILENTENYIRLAERNRSFVALDKLLKDSPEQTLFENVEAQTKVTKANGKEILNYLKSYGFDTSDIDPEDLHDMAIFRKQSQRTLGSDQFDGYIDGKYKVLRAIDPTMAEAFRALDGDTGTQSLVFKMANALTTIKKFGIAFTPEFIAKHLMRNQIISATLSDTGRIPFSGIFSAMGDIINEREPWQTWQKSGGGQGTFIDLKHDYVDNDVYGLQKKTGFLDTAFNLVKKPIQAMEGLGALCENATRLAEFKRASGGATEGPEVFKGGMAARNSTVDYTRIGAKLSAWNALTAFQNVGVQSIDRMTQAVKADPSGMAMKGLTFITAPTVALWFANRNDKRIQESPQYVKDLYWQIGTDSWQKVKDPMEAQGVPDYLLRTNKAGEIEINRGVVYRFSKPPELGMLFGTAVERMLDAYVAQNPKALDHIDETLMHTFIPSFVPDALQPIGEQFANKSFFNAAPIIPYSVEGELPEYQYTDYTSETAKALGKMVAVVPGLRNIGPANLKLASPAIIENYIKSWSGTLGQYALALADRALIASGHAPNLKPESTVYDIPFVKAFMVRQPSANSQSIIDFRARYDESQQVWKTINRLKETGQVDAAEQVFNEHKDELEKLDSTHKAITGLGQYIQKVYQMTDISKSDKRQIIDGAYWEMIQAARLGNEVMNGIDKARASVQQVHPFFLGGQENQGKLPNEGAP